MKRFEEEYKEYVRQNAPDLWERIESGVDERIAGTEFSKGRKKKTKKYYRYMRFGASVAACLAALVLAIPVWHSISSRDTDQTEWRNGARDTNVAIENIQESGMEDAGIAVDDAVDDAAQEPQPQVTVAADEAETEDIIYDEDNDENAPVKTEETMEETMPESSGEDMTTLAQAHETETEDDAGMSDTALDAFSADVETETVCVKVIAQELTDDGIIYTVEILEGSGRDVQKAQTWTVAATAEQGILETEKEYRLMLKNTATVDMSATLDRILE